jgi:flagellar motility protein MotE (MotC chaperone)
MKELEAAEKLEDQKNTERVEDQLRREMAKNEKADLEKVTQLLGMNDPNKDLGRKI